jgi:hypothetical protein
MERKFRMQQFDKLVRPPANKACLSDAMAKCAQIDRQLADFSSRLDRIEQCDALEKAKASRKVERHAK